MNNKNDLNRLEEALRNDEALRKKLDEACRIIAESGEVKNDGEVMVKAAAELGFSITIEELERAKAASEELSDDEMDKVAGGAFGEDNKGHDNWCLTAWHCMATTLHTETNTRDTDYRIATTHKETCWSNYECALFYHQSPFFD